MNPKRFALVLLFTTSILFVQAQNEGMATYFTGLGSPYGGCGIPQANLETQYFVALNTYDSPGEANPPHQDWLDGNPAPADKMGEFQNGLNCGRWVKVTLGPDCNGLNDGALGEDFCRGANAQWIDDQYSDAELYMIVADACPDENAWCRDNYYHLDMSQVSVSQFEKNGTAVGDDIFDHFNNRSITWEYVQAPNYTGDINIFMMINAQKWWPAISITNLKNGIHGIEQLVNGNWVSVEMNGTMGQSYILDNDNGAGTYTIRVYDAHDKLINNGREYSFSLPASCGGTCSNVTQASYTTFDPIPVPTEETINKVFTRSEFEQIGDSIGYIYAGDEYTHSLIANTADNNFEYSNGVISIATPIDDTPNQVTSSTIKIDATKADHIIHYVVEIVDLIDYYIESQPTVTYTNASQAINKESYFTTNTESSIGTSVEDVDFRVVIGTVSLFPNKTTILWDVNPNSTSKGFDNYKLSIGTGEHQNPQGYQAGYPLDIEDYSAINVRYNFQQYDGHGNYATILTSHISEDGTNVKDASISYVAKQFTDASTNPNTVPDTTINSVDCNYTVNTNDIVYSPLNNEESLSSRLELIGLIKSAQHKQDLSTSLRVVGTSIDFSFKDGFGQIGLLAYRADTIPIPPTTQTIELSNGWNLLSVITELNDTAIATLFPNAEVVKTSDGFYKKGQPSYLNTFNTIEIGKPYLIKNSITETISVTGYLKKNHTSKLQPGWNLFTGPVDKNWTIESLGTTNSFQIKDFSLFNNEKNQGTLFETIPGKAYFYNSDTQKTVTW